MAAATAEAANESETVKTEIWLAFVGTYRTLCLAPPADLRRMLTTMPQATAAT